MKSAEQTQPIENIYIREVAALCRRYFKNRHVQIYLYGSRACGTENETSDIDIAVKSSEITDVQMAKLREALHESHVPYKVDLLNWNLASKELKTSILQEGILLWEV